MTAGVAVGIVGDALLEIRCLIDDRARGENGVREVVIGLVVCAVGVVIFAVQQVVVDVPRPGDVLHVTIDPRIDIQIVIDALFAQLPAED